VDLPGGYKPKVIQKAKARDMTLFTMQSAPVPGMVVIK